MGGYVGKGGYQEVPLPERLEYPAIGLESEFSLLIDDVIVSPEKTFGDPRAFLGEQAMHRSGSSYHLPTGGAVYFDTGVVEVATPVIELEPGCAARAGRSLWESIHYVRQRLNDWEVKTGNRVRLQGFSTHYNISFELSREERGLHRTAWKLSKFLSYFLPVPVMLLGMNRRSTGVGVRPRGDRIEITADFTPDPSLMIATASFIIGVVRSIIRWPSYELEVLRTSDQPVIRYFEPIPHTSRKGWLARVFCYPHNPMEVDLNAPIWQLRDRTGLYSFREIGREIFHKFYRSIARISDPFSFRLMSAIFSGRTPSLMELEERPRAYEHVGLACAWDDGFAPYQLERSRYETVLMHAIRGDAFVYGPNRYVPIGMRGWSQVVFREVQGPRPGDQRTVSIDVLARHPYNWRATDRY